MTCINYSQIIDLSHVITPSIPLWPDDPAVSFEVVASQEQDGYYLRRFSMGEHSATHMNAPNTFYPDGIAIDGYCPESLVRPAVVIDVQDKVLENADYVITVEDVMGWEQVHGRIEAGSIVVFYTGWQRLWHDPEQFINEDEQGLHFPGVGARAAQFLLDERQIAGIGIDTHGVDPGQDTTFASNHLVLAKAGIILECLTRLDQLPPKGSTLVIGILRLEAGSGSPVSVLAFVP
ncbi:cyclase family protein [Pseudomonas helleri]|uniref:Cyclase family protein n=1 Tax=Pseudomonas helleri TaxID=1608996 RepID=A0A6G1W2G1_9PSED|nr:cyclase family protein [Pseudomonas helleri]MQT25217.1 cyclase family protein [Pseudomonas helleri]MQU16484.1 cyclase family protein [Pseudomonas helleri]